MKNMGGIVDGIRACGFRKRVALTTFLLAFSACTAYPGDGPALKVLMASKWLDLRGNVLGSNLIAATIQWDAKRAFIQPEAMDGDTNLVFFTWATSPFREHEWIVGAQSQRTGDTLTNVFINNHPVLGAQDTYANLVRVLYLPITHPTYSELSKNERLYLPIESGLYKPEEIIFEVARTTNSGVREILARTPNYFYKWSTGTNAARHSFRRGTGIRTLWRISVTSHVEVDGALLPATFEYKRWADPESRLDGENDSPVVLITGELLSAERKDLPDIAHRLAPMLSVADVRPTSTLGRAIRYSSLPGDWPEMSSPAYQQMVKSNRTAIERSLLYDGKSPPIRSARLIFFAGCVLTLPIILFLIRSPNRKQNQHIKHI